MTTPRFNLLTDPLLQVLPERIVSLPCLFDLLTRDRVDSYPAIRPHQAPSWHMFLVQLAALALNRAGKLRLPETEDEWLHVLRGLTPDFPDDEPWCLVVRDSKKPAFFQSPIPDGVKLDKMVPTPDALDLLITSRNHDLKAAVAQCAEAQDWIFSLASLQTSEGFGGAGNYGIVRMNGGSSSRPLLGLVPLSQENIKINAARPGTWFRRDVSVLLASRVEEFKEAQYLGYPTAGGLGLTWIAAWEEEDQLTLGELDIWFIEVCRRIRLSLEDDRILGRRGTSKTPRIAAKHLNGAVGDPWAPVHTTENKSLTLSGGSFDYRKLVEILLSGYWKIPILARPTAFEASGHSMLLVAQALSRGNCKTEGYKSRVLPIGGKISRALSLGTKRETLHELARKQMEEIKKFDDTLRNALALLAAGGDPDKLRKKHYVYTNEARSNFDAVADNVFFEHLWTRFEAQEAGGDAVRVEARRFAAKLFERAKLIFEAGLPAMPCGTMFRPRAEARARHKFQGSVRHSFPELFSTTTNEETDNAVA
jgi:CRISPR system Cascade subunit CasA